MKCLNTRGCYGKDAVHLAFSHNEKYIITDNFCSKECYLIYSGECDPPKKEHQVFLDHERQLIHDIYFKYFCDGIPKKKPGVKLGIKRGSYKKSKIANKLNLKQKERDCKKKHRERSRKYRERKTREEITRKQKLILEGA